MDTFKMGQTPKPMFLWMRETVLERLQHHHTISYSATNHS